jgi:hypothetical protein
MNTILYFNEELHKYTNESGLVYTSMTTVIGKYEEKFNVEEEAKKCHKKYFTRKGHRYYNMTVTEIKESWTKLNKHSTTRGNERHNYLEDIVKDSSGYTKVGANKFINDRIYTIDDILINHDFGRIDISYFKSKNLDSRYPAIYNIILKMVNAGWNIYSEIGVFYNPYMISGLVDILFVKGNEFKILDWKTNKAKLHFESGYFKRDESGKNTSHWVSTDNRFKPPLAHIQSSHGNTYTLQLSGYAWLIEQFGLTCTGLLLCQIRPKHLDEYGNIFNDNGEEIVDLVPIKYLKEEVHTMFKHHYRVHAVKQTTLNI